MAFFKPFPAKIVQIYFLKTERENFLLEIVGLVLRRWCRRMSCGCLGQIGGSAFPGTENLILSEQELAIHHGRVTGATLEARRRGVPVHLAVADPHLVGPDRLLALETVLPEANE